ncbi:hypothetical protein AVEN_138983-1, partial [Araneus ventricosus]
NLENRFPAVLDLWLRKEFYRDKYGMTSSNQAWTLDLGDERGNHFREFGDEMWDLKNAGIFSISLLGGGDPDLSR